MRARWVLTWKSTGKAKARLCVLGFQDPDLTEVSRDSPTLSAASEALIMQWVASHKYRLISGDIKTAFLSGDEDIRNIFISPPDDVRQMLNLGHETVLRLRKAVYGLVTAPKKWWDRLKTSLIKHGFTSCVLDPCAFVLQKSGTIHGVLGVHFDDVIGGGNETFDRIMTTVRTEFDLGEQRTLAIFGSRVARFRRCHVEKLCATWNSTSMSLNNLMCPRQTKPSLSVS